MIKRLPWLRRLKKTDPEPPVRLPIADGALSNGEGWWPDSARKRLIRKLVLEKAEEISRRHNVDRREFLASACGSQIGALDPDGRLSNQFHVLSAALGRIDKRFFGSRAFDGQLPDQGGYGYDRYGNPLPGYDRDARATRP